VNIEKRPWKSSKLPTIVRAQGRSGFALRASRIGRAAKPWILASTVKSLATRQKARHFASISIAADPNPVVMNKNGCHTMLKSPLLRLSTLALLIGANPAGAYELYADDSSHLNATLEAVFGAFHSQQNYSQSGRLPQRYS